jgi:hypothetical protein
MGFRVLRVASRVCWHPLFDLLSRLHPSRLSCFCNTCITSVSQNPFFDGLHKSVRGLSAQGGPGGPAETLSNSIENSPLGLTAILPGHAGHAGHPAEYHVRS